MELNFGDCSRAPQFDLVMGDERQVITATFDAHPGEEFVVMLLGTAKIGEPADVDKMVAQLGFVASDGGAEEILHLKGVIADLEAKLAAKG